MRIEDHFHLAQFLIGQSLQQQSVAYQNAFVMGNLFPDLNFVSYLRGTISQEPCKGHAFESAAGYLQKLMQHLENTSAHTLLYAFRLGKLMHYTADSFTFPHNNCFHIGLRQHIAYEKNLHQVIQKTDLHAFVPEQRSVSMTGTLWEQFLNLHTTYLQSAGTCQWDIRFICSAVQLELDWLLLPQEVSILPAKRSFVS